MPDPAGAASDKDLVDSLLEASNSFSAGRTQEAEDLCRKAISANPANAEAQLLLAHGYFEEAGSLLKEAISLSPLEGAPYQLYTRSKKIAEDDKALVVQM